MKSLIESVRAMYAEAAPVKPEVAKAFPAPGVKTGAPAPAGTSTMPKDKVKAKGMPAGAMGEATMMQDDGKMVHNCAKHVEHAEYGKGSCIAEEHADPDRYGNIAWYDIEFPHGVERGVPISELKVLQAESHGHTTKKAKKVMENDGNLANNAKPYDKVTHGDVIAGRLGKDEYGGKKKKPAVKEEAETVEFSLTEEEWDQLDELSKSTLGSYVKKSSRDSRITRKIAADFENKADRARSPGMKAASNELSDKFKSKSFKRQAGMDKAVDRLTKEEVEQVDEIILHKDVEFEVNIAEKDYKTYFQAAMKGKDLATMSPEEKKKHFNKVDAGYKAKNEEVFLEAMFDSHINDIIAAHKKSGNRVSDEKSAMSDGKMKHSYVITTPEGKRTRHIHHGSTKRLETMSPAARSKQSQEQDLEDKD